MECRKCPDDADHDRHRMCVAAEPGVEPDHLLMRHRVLHDAVFKHLVLLGSWQLAVKQEISCFEKAAVLSELFDRITAIEYDPFVEVDEGDPRLAACC